MIWSMSFLHDFTAYFQSGGLAIMLPLALLAVYIYYMGFELLFTLIGINSICKSDQKLMDRFSQSISKNTDDLPNVRSRIKRDFDMLRLSFMPEVDRGIKILSVLASVAPLLGLLGTVTGMTLAISTMGAAKGSISEGVSLALITTQCGLTIAIPALVIRMFCSRLRQKILVNISRFESRLIRERFAK